MPVTLYDPDYRAWLTAGPLYMQTELCRVRDHGRGTLTGLSTALSPFWPRAWHIVDVRSIFIGYRNDVIQFYNIQMIKFSGKPRRCTLS